MNKRTVDWSRLPKSLSYLIPYADKYGVIQFESGIHELLKLAQQQEIEELTRISRRFSEDGDQIEAFISRYRITKDPASRRLYFLGVLFAEGHDLGIW
jgi:hypothetical protein